MKRSVLLLVFASFVCTGAALAQTNDLTSPLVMLLTPEYPSPNSSAEIKVQSVSLDLESATIAWLENDKLIESGIGRTRHSLRTGKAGSKLTVTVVAQTRDGRTYENNILISPASVDLVWESESPPIPFYRGKSLYGRFGKLRVIALPEIIDSDGRLIPASELNYKWTMDDEVVGESSGFGRSSLSITKPIYRTPATVGVVVSKGGTTLASSDIEIDVFEPSVLLYENSPLYGILFNRAIRNFNLAGTEITLEAFPLTIKAASRKELRYEWTVNGETVSDFSGPFITFRNVSNESGTASVGLSVLNENIFASQANAQFTITYGKNGP